MEDKRAVALYIRLSVEDGDLDDNSKPESNSITNQRTMLRQYINSHHEFDGDEILEFVDDGFSGTNFNRPRFSEMITGIVYKRIKCIIVKDFSRFGRNYLEAGYYLEKMLPLCDVRFISLNDGFDSDEHKGRTGGIGVAVKNFLNNMYSRDNSQKVIIAMKQRAREGQYMAAFTPYGYIKDPKDKHRLIIDEEAAVVIRDIFNMAAEGCKRNEIVRTLNEKGVPTATEHMNKVGVNKRPRKNMEKKLWSTQTIGDMIKNPVYIGSTVWNKSKVISVGAHRQKKNPRSEWIIAENTHEPIVSKEVFELANRNTFTGKKVEERGRRKAAIFFCGSCGRIAGFTGSLKSYRCCNAANTGLPDCQYSKRKRDVLEGSTLMMAKSRASEKLEELQKLKSVWKRDIKHLKGTDAIADREKKQTEKKLRIYEQYKRGKMDKDTYLSEMKDVTSKLEELRGTLAEIEKRKTTGEYNLNASIEVEKKLKAVVDLDSFDNDTLKLVLDRVLIKADGTEEYIWKDLGIV